MFFQSCYTSQAQLTLCNTLKFWTEFQANINSTFRKMEHFLSIVLFLAYGHELTESKKQIEHIQDPDYFSIVT